MQIPLQVIFRDIPHSEFIKKRVYKKVEKFKKYTNRITFCRVIVEAPHRHHNKGKLYHVCIDLSLPGEKIVVARDTDDHSHEDVYIAIRDAFEAARRQLKKSLRQKRESHRRVSKSARTFLNSNGIVLPT